VGGPADVVGGVQGVHDHQLGAELPFLHHRLVTLGYRSTMSMASS
jgi:hypothetical protein